MLRLLLQSQKQPNPQPYIPPIQFQRPLTFTNRFLVRYLNARNASLRDIMELFDLESSDKPWELEHETRLVPAALGKFNIALASLVY